MDRFHEGRGERRPFEARVVRAQFNGPRGALLVLAGAVLLVMAVVLTPMWVETGNANHRAQMQEDASNIGDLAGAYLSEHEDPDMVEMSEDKKPITIGGRTYQPQTDASIDVYGLSTGGSVRYCVRITDRDSSDEATSGTLC